MSQENSKKNKRALKIRAIFGRKDNQAKIFFLFLAFFLWLIINLSREEGYIKTLSFPVEYQNLPDQRELKNAPPSEILLKLKASGVKILKYQLANFMPLIIDVSELESSGNTLYSYWITKNKRTYIQNQLDKNVEILQILPDTIKFEFEKLMHKKVPIILNLKTDFDAFTTFYSAPIIQPDSVLLSGSEEDLAKIDSVFTSELLVNGNTEDVDKQLNLLLNNTSSINYSTEAVKVELRVAKLTEKVFEQDVELRQIPEGVEVVVFPKQVSVKLQLALEDYDHIKSIQVRAFVKVQSGIKNEQENFLTVELDSLPDYIRRSNIEPKRVEYIMSKK